MLHGKNGCHLRFSLVCIERVCRFKCSERVKTLRQLSTGHAKVLPLPGCSSMSFVGTCRPLAFLVRLGTITGMGLRGFRPAVLRAATGLSGSDSGDNATCSPSAAGEPSGDCVTSIVVSSVKCVEESYARSHPGVMGWSATVVHGGKF